MKQQTSAFLTEEEIKAKKLLDEKEPDSKLRLYEGFLGKAITILFLIWAVFQMYANTIGFIDAMALRTWHLFFLLTFTFLLFPTFKNEKRIRSFPPIWDIGLLVLSVFTFGYLLINYTTIAKRGGYLLPFDLVIAGVAMLLLFEGGRRACKNLAILGLIFFLYNFLGQFIL